MADKATGVQHLMSATESSIVNTDARIRVRSRRPTPPEHRPRTGTGGDAPSTTVPKSKRPHWMSTAEVAAVLGITLRTRYRLIDEGELPAYKMGRVIRLRTADVEAYRDANGGGQPG